MATGNNKKAVKTEPKNKFKLKKGDQNHAEKQIQDQERRPSYRYHW